MSNLNRHPVRRAAVGVLAGTLAFTGGAIAVGVSPANALPGFTFERLAGADRFGTAAAIARDGFGTAETVILASGATRNFPDALTGNFLAGDEQAPILLTQPGSLPRVTSDAFASLNTRRVIIVGGTSAVSAEVERQVRSRNITVERVGGIDRYATAELVAQRVAGSTPATSTAVGEDPAGLRTAILGNGQDFPDILAAGPLSFAEAFPIAITPNTSSTLDPRTRDVLEDLDIERVIIVGGTTAVTPGVEAEVRQITNNDVTRLAGTQRFQTAIAVADFAYDQLDFDESHINLARSDDFADALTGGPHGGLERAPIVITTPTSLHPATEAFLDRRCPTLTDGHIFGGVVAISNATEAEAEAAASSCVGEPPAEEQPTIAVVADDTTLTAGEPFTGTINSDEPITSVAISGECINDVTGQTDQDTATGGFQFSVDTIEDPNGGDCVVTFTATFADGSTATDTVTITVTPAEQPGPGQATALSLTPETDVNPVGSAHTVTATLTDAQGNPSVDGELVRFEVFPASGGAVEEAAVVTAADGSAQFTFTDNGVNGEENEDIIVACVVPNRTTSCTEDTDGDNIDEANVDPASGEVRNINQNPSDTARKSFERRQAATLTLTPESATNVLSDTHTVTATVTDQFGDPIEGQTVTFERFRDVQEPETNPATADSGFAAAGGTTDTTGDSANSGDDATAGQATFSFTDTQESNNLIVACLDSDGDGCAEVVVVQNGPDTVAVDQDDEINDTATKQFVEREERIASLSPANETNPVGEPHTVTATVVDQFGDNVEGDTVRFEVFERNANGDFAPGGTPSQGTDMTTVNDQGTADTSDDTTEATFTFTSAEAGEFVIVACLDEGDNRCASVNLNGDLVLDEGNRSTATAEKTFVALNTTPANGTFTGEIIAADDANNTIDIFTTDDRFVRVTFNNDDLFRIEGTAVDMPRFERGTTRGDAITVTLNEGPDADQRSTLDITDDVDNSGAA